MVQLALALKAHVQVALLVLVMMLEEVEKKVQRGEEYLQQSKRLKAHQLGMKLSRHCHVL